MFKTTLTKPDGRALHLYSRRPIPASIEPTNPVHDDQPAKPHFRWHPLRREWVVYASHRQNRTFLPPKDYSPLAISKSKDFPTEMPAGDYEIAVFDNLFPSLNQITDAKPKFSVPTEPAKGICEVVVFTQNPDTSLGELPLDRVKLVLEVLAERTKALREGGKVQYVLPFENRGVEQGVTLHHPHGQLYAYPFVPPVVAAQLASMKTYWDEKKSGLLEKFIQDEKLDGRRVIFERPEAIAFVPVCARYPYETWIAPIRPVQFLEQLTPSELQDFAHVLKMTLMKFDRLWSKPFPYLLLLYQAPLDGKDHPEAHLHIEIYPPLRTRDRLKYLAGTELGAGVFINDSLPEEKAAELANVQVSDLEFKGTP
ncbi:MAG: galactose-1-phosphate uridylyltransferase [Bdellovibrionales bacterium]|nr:galactose-1-phosphate uridylyltransferase [Oligoflexia bacterium]